MRKIKFQWLLYILFFAAALSPAKALDLKSNVIVLMDFSNSYFTTERLKSAIPDNFKKLSEAIGSKRDGPDKPSLIQVLPITGLSQQGRPICEYVMLRKNLFVGTKSDCGIYSEALCSNKLNDFKDFMSNQCSKRVTGSREAAATDISGALGLASQIGQSQGGSDKFLIVFSDMFEFRDPKLPVSKINLNSFHVLVVCGAEFNSEADTIKLCMGTEGLWSQKLKRLGAESVTYVIESGSWYLGSAKEFFERG